MFTYSYLLLCCLVCTVTPQDKPIDIVNAEEYEGTYLATQPGQTFQYLDGREGRLIAIFYGQPNRETVNSVNIFFLDPRYEDLKMAVIQIKELIDMGEGSEWNNDSHHITLTTLWKQRQQDQHEIDNVATSIKFTGLDSQDYSQVSIAIHMKGPNFEFTAQLTYYRQVISTLAYSLYVTFVVALQIYSGYVLVRIMDAPNFVFTAKMSLLTLSLCNIQDFSQTMDHIQYIMGSESGYLFFIMPSLAYVVLFIIFDMKMLFLVWRSHNLRNIDQPQILRKRLTAFYIQFYLGLFLYLTLVYFFNSDDWMIILRHLILLPQIIHNIRLGNNPGFNPFYIFGFIGTRLLIPFYERLCPQNRFRLAPSLTLVVVLFSLYALEVLLLYLQARLGSRFFVPKRFQPNYFNYRQKLKLSTDTAEIDCSICLQNLFEPVASGNINESTLDSSLTSQPLHEQITVMTTPCRHYFHEECLSQWMEVKLECPTCRTPLPPI